MKKISQKKIQEIIMVITDRVSAFDHILGTIPQKGALLTKQTVFWFEQAKNIIDNAWKKKQAEKLRKARLTTELESQVIGGITSNE